jgi:hypothetical protein
MELDRQITEAVCNELASNRSESLDSLRSLAFRWILLCYYLCHGLTVAFEARG